MLYILLSILSSTLIVLIFKLTERFNIPIFQIVVLNYFSAFSLGFFLNDTEISTKMLFEQPWMPFAVLIGTGFIIMFFLMGKAARNSGVTATTVAGKMSVALPVLFSMLFYSEEITLYKIGGIVLALLGVILMVYKPINGVSAKKIDLLPFVLFVGFDAIWREKAMRVFALLALPLILIYVWNYVPKNIMPADWFMRISTFVNGQR